jgi:hypothetical protein
MYLHLSFLDIPISECNINDIYESVRCAFTNGWIEYHTKCISYYNKLKSMPSPGCDIQKYLRSYRGIAAHSRRVLSVLQFVALLPHHISFAITTNVEDPMTDSLLYALCVPRKYIDEKLNWRKLYRQPTVCLTNVYNAEFFKRYLHLLAWITLSSSIGNEELRLVMAQYDQLSLRNFGASKRFLGRCVTSLECLIKIGNQEYDDLDFWA